MSLLSYPRAALTILTFAIFAATAAAQTPAVIDPRIVEFDPSPDHSATGASGPVVTRYDLELYVLGGTQPLQVANLGKPAPQGDGKVRVDFTTLLSPWPAAGTVYEARVAAVGPSGVGRSTESNTFSFSSPCSSSISPTSVSVNGAASTGTVAVTGITGCTWSATSAVSWITITAGASGNGSGTVSYSVAANPSSSQRSGTLTISGHTFTVTQAGGCTYTTTPSATSVSASATTGTANVTTTSGCAWTASSGVSWISITGGSSGTGSGTVSYSIAANTSTSQRSGTLTVAGRAITITQDGAACNYVLSPVSATLGSNAATGTINVTAASGCAWTASDSASWISITSSTSGSGNGQVTYSVTANPGTSSRSGTITIGGETFTITQAGQTCTYAISPVSTSVPAGATSGSVSVDTLSGCAWTATPSASWISITSGANGTGDGTVAFNVGANPDLASRTGTIAVGGKTFTITQAPVVCTATIAPVTASVGSGGAQGSVAVTLPGACSWTASSPVSWITINAGATGLGNGSVTYTVAANTSTSARSADLTIAGKTFSVTQSGITCSYTVSPTTASATATAGTGTVTVTSAAGCAWTASSAVSWMSITSTPSGSGNGTVTYAFTANPTTQSRAGVLTVAGQAVTVTQAAGCGYSISPASASVTASAGSGTVNVTAGSACAWSAQSPASWVTFSTATSGTGTGSVGYVVAANPNSSSRSATITVAGQPFVITQAGAACNATLTPTAQAISAAGGNGSVNIALPGGCAWSAVSSVSWITVLTGASGSGNGTVTYRVDANAAGTGRTGTIAIGGRLLTITQGAASCTATVSSTSESFEAAGGSRVVAVTIPSACLWTGVSNATWITVTSGGGPNTAGNGAVTFSVAPNTSTNPRTGTLTIAGRTVTVDQAGTCDIAISPNAVSAGSDASSGSVAVTTGASCSWSATASASWLSVTSGTNGAGSGTVVYAMTANTGNTARTGSLTIGGRVFSVTQSAPTCAIVLSTTSVSLTSATAFRTVQVNTGATCGWTANSSVPWISIVSGGSGTGVGSVAYSVAANTGTASRTGIVTIGGETVTISQAGATCTSDLSPTAISLSSASSNETVAVLTPQDCNWTASSNASWLMIFSGSTGQGDGLVHYSVAPNSSPFARVGTMTIAGRTFTISQAGSSCTTSLSSSAVSVGAAPSTVSVNVSTGSECAWTASSAASWISVGGGSGTGSGTVTLSIAQHTGSSVRTGTVSIAGKSFIVTQSGSCDYSVSPTSVTVAGGNSLASVWVTSGSGCGWAASSPVPWITLSTSSGSGTGMINITVAPNPTASTRTATLTVAGSTVQVNQAGAACNYLVSPVSLNITGGSHTISIAAPAGCAWAASATVPWITFSGNASGSGDGSVVVQFGANTGFTTRFGSINLAGWRIFVTQRVSAPPSAPSGMRVVQPGN